MANKNVISTHVLDTRLGRPATGMRVQLYRLEGSGSELETTAATNDDGRVSELSSAPLRPGRYRIVFDVAGYAESQGDDPSFFAALAAEIEIRDVSRRYHVPLILSPHSCMTYLGS
jgi:5-hydroxyisourate hydrolase